MQYSLAAFYEPRGVMRILQLIFAIIAFATTANFSTRLDSKCIAAQSYNIEYPFRVDFMCNKTNILIDVSASAQFFVATGVLSMMYCVFIIAVYAMIDELYRTKSEFPLADFFLTITLGVFWLVGSSTWANETSVLKSFTDPEKLATQCRCPFTIESFSKLNISLVIGFLNFFLWASDLWFLYKETIWFQGRHSNAQHIGAGTSTMTQPN